MPPSEGRPVTLFYFKFERVHTAMERFLAKIQRIYDGVEGFYPTAPPGEIKANPAAGPIMPKPEGDDPNTLHDYVLAFFIFSHNLKDWIINDKEVSGLKSDRKKRVEAFISANECLGTAADIANGAKHFVRNVEPRSGVQPEWLWTQSKITNAFIDGYLRVIVKSKGTFYAGTKEIDALKLAKECMSKWEEFIGMLYEEHGALKNAQDRHL